MTVFISMTLTRYIIWTTSFKDTNTIMDILTEHCGVIVSITDLIICVETRETPAKIRSLVGDEMEMACIEIDDKFIKKLLKTKFQKEERKNFERFLDLTWAPNSIDEALDLINERGGIEYLLEREVNALDRLTNNPISDI